MTKDLWKEQNYEKENGVSSLPCDVWWKGMSHNQNGIFSHKSLGWYVVALCISFLWKKKQNNHKYDEAGI